MTQKWAVLALLLFLPINLVAAHNRVTVEAGHEAVLSCPNISVSLVMVTWKRNGSSLLSYKGDNNETSKLNYSERIMWKYSPYSDHALRIYPVNLGDEGNYVCEIVNSAGNFWVFSSLTVIVPPTVTLTHDKSRVAVCQASAAKPAADISWIPANNHSTEEEFHHPDGTVTRVSYYGWANSALPSVTCLVTHPATNQTLHMDLPYTSHSLLYLLIGAAAVTGAGVASCLIFRCRARWFCKCTRGLAEPSAIKTSKFTPSHVRREAVKLHIFPEKIYENYSPRSVYALITM